MRIFDAVERAAKVTPKRVTVTPESVTPRRQTFNKMIDMAAAKTGPFGNAAKQKAYRERKAMGGKTWEAFVAETEASHG